MNTVIAPRKPIPYGRNYFYVGGNGKRLYRSHMRRYGIVLISINALASLFLMFLEVRWIKMNGEVQPIFLVLLLPLILSLIYIWRTINFDDQSLAALKVEREKLETIKRIKELRKELGEE